MQCRLVKIFLPQGAQSDALSCLHWACRSVEVSKCRNHNFRF